MSTAVTKPTMPRRPDYLKAGRSITLDTNFFLVRHILSGIIYQYDVSITPEIPSSRCREIFRTWESENKELLRNILPVYDGRSTMYTKERLNIEKDTQQFELKIYKKEDKERRGRPQRFNFQIKKVGEINMDRLHMFLDGKVTTCPEETIMAIDVVLRNKPSLIFTPIGRCFFNRDDHQSAFGGIEFWRGYYQSVRPGNGKIYINMDVAAAAFYEPKSALDVLARAIGRDIERDIRGPLSEHDLKRAERELKGLKFITNHTGGKRRRYKITGLTTVPTDRLKFQVGKSDREDTVSNYFQNRYNIRLNYPFLPCIIADNPKKHIYMPIEVCEIIEGQRYNKKLNDKQTSDMIKFTCQPPNKRADAIRKGIDIISDPLNNEYQEAYEISFDTKMTSVEAHVLPEPRVYYNQRGGEKSIKPNFGKWNLKDKVLARCNEFKSWSVVVFAPQFRLNSGQVLNFIRQLSDICIKEGMQVPQGEPPVLHANPNGNIKNILAQSFEDAHRVYGRPPQLIICVLPDTKAALYNSIKRVSDTELGVPTQCVQSNKVQRPNPMYCANVSLKMNVKLGGINSYLGDQLKFITEKPTIVFGADVTHPPPGGDPNRSSIVSLVGSMDAQCARYHASLRTQQAKLEIIRDIRSMMKELLVAFYKSTGVKPERILFYRDGISEGQFNEALRVEITEIFKAFDDMEPGYRPTLTYVVVQKRHHTKFFPRNKGDADRSGNIPPGTVVDNTITHPVNFDFYLCSHAGIQGTSKASHYYVIYDENNFSSESLQTLTYNMCYLYCRATCSVSIPPPVYYAHLAASRARCYLNGWDDSESDRATVASGSNNDPNPSNNYSLAPVIPHLRQFMFFM